MWKRLQVAKVALLSNGHVGAKHQMKDGEYGYAATRAKYDKHGKSSAPSDGICYKN